ncbi:MAG: diversity-generating retroelement protein Avd [Chloroflexi bacterium]|nr:diversity-generating retroelement protein Avd [Chloroflexota bacterium]
MKQSPIFSRTYDLLLWLLPLTIKFPRQQRFVLAQSLQRTALRFHEQLIEAAYSDEPGPVLKGADVTLAKLRFYLRLSHDLALLNPGQYAHVTRRVVEIGKLLGGWRKKDNIPGGVEQAP